MLQSDLFTSLGGRRFDLVVVNPPYFAKDPVDDAERAWFAGATSVTSISSSPDWVTIWWSMEIRAGR